MAKTTKQHERDRVASMTDAQLDVRYGKMTKPEKIKAFFEELQIQGRHRQLQYQIANDMGFDMNKPPNVYSITHPKYGKIVFEPDGDVVCIRYYDGALHKSLKNGELTTEDSRTGIKRARKIWDEKIEEGWIAQ
jgi:hypothetical protein